MTTTGKPETLFGALAHPLRLRALVLLAEEGELCVCELTYVLGVVQPMVSRHLAQLREAALVADRRQGQWIHYRLHPDLPEWVQRVVTDTVRGVRTQEPFASDRRALAAMPNRPDVRCYV